MKRFKQLVQELPSKKVVFAFGRFQPPTIGHGLLVSAVKKIADKQGADHVIFASRTQDKKQNPLPVDRKVYYLNRMFPKTNFVAATDEIRTFVEAAKMLSQKYKNLIMVAGSDRVQQYESVLQKYNGKEFKFETIEVISAGERDPDSDTAAGMSGTKMRDAAKKGDFLSFKKGLPKTLTELDSKRLMNEIRQGLGIETIKEHVEFDRSEIREQYHAGEIFNVGDAVTDGSSTFEIVDRGANYLTVVNEHGEISKKWLDSVTPTVVQEDILPGPIPKEVTFKGYTTKNLHHSEDSIRAFETTIDRYNKGQIKDAVAILNALKATDAYMKVNDLHLEQGKAPDQNEVKTWVEAHSKARDSLNRIGEFMHHFDYWHMHEHELQDLNTKYNPESEPATEMSDSFQQNGRLIEMKYTSSDKIKVARVIASALGVEEVEKTSNPEQLINNALRKIRSKPMRPEYVDVIKKMLLTADEAGISYDKKLIPQKVEENVEDLSELSNELLGRYKKSASQDASDADKRGDFTRGNKRFSGIVKATKKQFKNATNEDVSQALHRAAIAKMMGKDDQEAKRKLRVAKFGQDEKENESDLDAQDLGSDQTVGASMHDPSTESPSARKMKIAYREQTEIDEELPFKSDDTAPEAKDIRNKIGEEAEDADEETDGITDKDIDDMVNGVDDEEDILDVYDDSELALVDDETGEHIQDIKEEVINEVLSRIERIKAKAKFAKSQAKRERKIKLALKSRSSTSTLNARARRLAIQLMKQRLAKKPLNSLSVSEKERIEKVIQKRKALINRLAMKLAPRVRKIEIDRLTHKSYTK